MNGSKLNSVSMDRLDRKIVEELQKEGGLSNLELAERVGSTAPSCWRRIKQMEEAGIFQKTVRLVDRKALGQTVNVVCHVRMSSHSSQNIAAFEAMVSAERCILECYSMGGEWDFLLQIVARDVESYEAFLMQKLLKHPSVSAAASHFCLRVVKYSTAVPFAE